ncbi:MAG: hypothetical protein WC126_03940 [Proteiniphilum sp.]
MNKKIRFLLSVLSLSALQYSVYGNNEEIEKWHKMNWYSSVPNYMIIPYMIWPSLERSIYLHQGNHTVRSKVEAGNLKFHADKTLSGKWLDLTYR